MTCKGSIHIFSFCNSLNSVTAAGNQSDIQCANDEWEGLDWTYRSQFVYVLLLQSCPTLCDSMDCSAPGSSVHGFLQARITGVGCRFLFQGIFPTQGLNLYLLSLLHWQVSSLPLVPPGEPTHRIAHRYDCIWHTHFESGLLMKYSSSHHIIINMLSPAPNEL